MDTIRRLRPNKGFTLIELLTTVVIVGVLAAAALPNFLSQTSRSRTTEATAILDAIKSGQQIHLEETSEYAQVGNVANGNCYPALRSGESGGIVETPGTVAQFSGTLGIDIDPSAATRWVFATRRSLIDPNRIKIAAEGIDPAKTTGMGIYFDNSTSQTDYGRVLVDGDRENMGPATCS